MSTENKIEDLPLSGIVPSKEGSTEVLRESVVVFIGWIGVAFAEVLMGGLHLDSAAQMSTPVHYLYMLLEGAGGVEFYASIATPLLLLSLLDLSPGRRILAAVVGGAAITVPFSAAQEVASALEVASIPRYGIQPDLWYFLGSMSEGISDGVMMTVAFGLTVAIPFSLMTVAAERMTDTKYGLKP